jgi:hypothetical protein
MISTPPTFERTASDDARYRINCYVLYVALGILTVGLTIWLWLIHPIFGIAATFAAKHVLVALLAAGLDIPPVTPPQPPEGPTS